MGRALLNLAMTVSFCLPSVGTAQQNLSTEVIAAGKIYQPFTGAWTGELEYRDYQSNERVKLPTWLAVQPSSDGRELQFHYIYDDGPTKVVEELQSVTVDTQNSTFTVVSNREKSKDTYQLAGLKEFAAAGRGTLELTGSATENQQKVDVRITIKVGRNYYRYEKETRAPGGNFQFRDGYSFTRRDPPLQSGR